MNLATDLIKAICPQANISIITEMVNTFNESGASYGINTPDRLAAFIAQIAHESDHFQTTQEYASGSKYEGRKDLGNTQAGDGVRFKGRGLIQTTGRSNYADTSKHLFGDANVLLNNPTLLENPKNATLSAMYFWNKKGLNQLADKGEFKTITKRINGGLNGYAERVSFWNKAKNVLKKKFSYQFKPTQNMAPSIFSFAFWSRYIPS